MDMFEHREFLKAENIKELTILSGKPFALRVTFKDGHSSVMAEDGTWMLLDLIVEINKILHDQKGK
jgi:hypothetical protein